MKRPGNSFVRRSNLKRARAFRSRRYSSTILRSEAIQKYYVSRDFYLLSLIFTQFRSSLPEECPSVHRLSGLVLRMDGIRKSQHLIGTCSSFRGRKPLGDRAREFSRACLSRWTSSRILHTGFLLLESNDGLRLPDNEYFEHLEHTPNISPLYILLYANLPRTRNLFERERGSDVTRDAQPP